MINEKKLLKIFFFPHISEKSSMSAEKFNTVVAKVPMRTTKTEIKQAIQNFFKVQVKCINTLIVQGKKKQKNGRTSYLRNWKKVYISLKKGQNINFMGNIE